MSLDVWLTVDDEVVGAKREAIFIREAGGVKEISRKEWDRRFPDRDPVLVTVGETNKVYSANITHNLNTMADKAGIYKHLWRPEEIGIVLAKDLIAPLEVGLKDLLDRPDYFKQFNPENGWGDYGGLLNFVEGYLSACKQWPNAKIGIWR